MTTNQATGVTFHPISQRDKELYGEGPTQNRCYYCQEDLLQRDTNGTVTEVAGQVLGHHANVFYPNDEGEDGEQQSLHLVHRHCLERQADNNAMLLLGDPQMRINENDYDRGYIIDCGVCRRKINNMDRFIALRIRYILWLKESHPAVGNAIQNAWQRGPEVISGAITYVREVVQNTWQRGPGVISEAIQNIGVAAQGTWHKSLVSGAISGAIINVIKNDRSLEGAVRGAISGGLTGIVTPFMMGYLYNGILIQANWAGYEISREGLRRVPPNKDLTNKIVFFAGLFFFMPRVIKLTKFAITTINKAPESRSYYDLLGFYNITQGFASMACYYVYTKDWHAFMNALENQLKQNKL